MTIVTYQPTECEISQIISTGKTKHNAFTFLYDDAATILRRGHIGFAFEAWHCLSQSDPTQVYTLAAPSGHPACNCPAYSKSMYKICDRIYCKHLIGYYALLQILTAQFNTRWIGNFLDPQAVQRYRAQPNTWLLQNFTTPSFHSWTGDHGHFVCFAQAVPSKRVAGGPLGAHKDEPSKRFAPTNPLQFAQFSNWLSQANLTLVN